MPYKEASSFEATKSVWGASKTTTVKESRSVAVGDAAAADILLVQWNILAPAWLPATATVLRDDGSAEYWTVCTNTRLGGESYVGDFSPHYLTVCVCACSTQLAWIWIQRWIVKHDATPVPHMLFDVPHTWDAWCLTLRRTFYCWKQLRACWILRKRSSKPASHINMWLVNTVL